MSMTLFEADLTLPLFGRGKVRDTYDLGDKLLIVSTDRLSAFDVVLPDPIPDKGLVLNQISCFWFEKTSQVMPNHLITPIDTLDSLKQHLPPNTNLPDYLLGRSMITLKAERVSVECVVRGYISGSAWAEYKQAGTISGTPAPKGLQESQELPEPIFTPTTKAEAGHDEPLSEKETENLVGKSTARELEEKSLAVYQHARDYAQGRGIIIADTKFEFGFVDGKLILIDEILTPDSSRFWNSDQYTIGRSQPSLDKQPVRDWLADSGWNKEPPAPKLPPEVIKATTLRYVEAYQRLTGRKLQNVSS
ncbi:MAG: phosphoribosylaminoimidazolesuccinocarboxamide synthase [Chloroflexota bacterium]|nr:MAG: phosphoribosylaminoimidazolesuccinocarboxamide synthase [Chloroflexota bacterium]